MDTSRCRNCEGRLGAASTPVARTDTASQVALGRSRPDARHQQANVEKGQAEGGAEARGIDGSYVLLRMGDMMLSPGADNTGAAEKEAAPLQSSPTSARSHGLEAWRSEDLKRAERLQAYATGQVEIETAMCAHCLKQLEEMLEQELEGLRVEERLYTQAKEQSLATPVSRQSLAELDALLAIHQKRLLSLKVDLQKSEVISAGLVEEQRELRERERDAAGSDREFWTRMLELELAAYSDTDEFGEALREVSSIHARADRLAAHSVLTDLFGPQQPAPRPTPPTTALRHSRSGSGDDALSLNGFRLSRHPVPNKELWWPEINAAWGQVVLLVMSLSNLAGYSNAHYRLVFLGPASKLIQDPGSPNQDIFPLFVKKKGAIDESVRRLCLVVADLQRHVMSQHESARPSREERLVDLPLHEMREESAWNTALRTLLAALRWMMKVVDSAAAAQSGQHSS